MPEILHTLPADPWGIGVACMFLAIFAFLAQCGVLALIERRRNRRMTTIKPRAEWRAGVWDEE